MARFDVLAVGELNPDLILAGIRSDAPRLGSEQEFGGYHLTLGSSTAITCVLMRRLGLATALSAWVGDDDYGRFCRNALAREQVDTRLVRTAADQATGVTVCLPYPQDRLLLTCKGAMALDPAEAIGEAALRDARHLHIGSFFLQDALRPVVARLFATARRLGLTTSLDTGWDPAERWLTDELRAALAETDYLLPNSVEFEHLSGETDLERGMARLRGLGVGTVVLKRGGNGAVQSDAAGIHVRPGFAANPVDTTGAGDAFNAGYLAALLQGKSVAERLTFANACGALTVAAIGGTGGVTGADQVRTFVAAREAAAA